MNDPFENDYKKQTGHTYPKSVSLNVDSVYSFEFTANTIFAEYDQGTKEYTIKHNTYSECADLEIKEMPIGLSIVKDEDGNQYIYSSENIYLNIELEWDLTIQKVDNKIIATPKANIEFVATPSYIS